MSLPLNFEGKVILVTGSSSGIGEAIAVLFAQLGGRVVVTGRNEARIQGVVEKCLKISPKQLKPLAVVADLTVDEDIHRLIKETIDEWGQIDVLINSAGAARRCPVGDPNSVDVFDFAIKTELRSAFVVSNLAVPHLIKSKGVIVNIGAPLKPYPGFGPGMIAKAGIEMMTKALALELGPKGVRVNSVSPGMIDTPWAAAMGLPADDLKTMSEGMKAFAETLPVPRMGQPADVAAAVVFLASNNSAYITGSSLPVDGGVALK